MRAGLGGAGTGRASARASGRVDLGRGVLPRRWPAVTGVGLAGSSVPGLAASWPETKIVSATSDHIVLTVTVPPYALESVEAEGRIYTRITGSGLRALRARGPAGPSGHPGAGCPSAGSRAAACLGGTLRGEPSRWRAGGPRREPRGLSPDRAHRRGDAPTSSTPRMNPSTARPRRSRPRTSGLTDRGRLRHQEVVKVLVAPFTYEPAREEVAVVTGFTDRALPSRMETPARQAGDRADRRRLRWGLPRSRGQPRAGHGVARGRKADAPHPGRPGGREPEGQDRDRPHRLPLAFLRCPRRPGLPVGRGDRRDHGLSRCLHRGGIGHT